MNGGHEIKRKRFQKLKQRREIINIVLETHKVSSYIE